MFGRLTDTSAPFFGALLPKPFLGFKDITTRLLDDLKGRATVSKQYLLDATNRAELKQPERELFRELLKDEPSTVGAKDFASKVKTELLPLKTLSSKGGEPMYENVALPDDLRGRVADYHERIYESPIKTSAGDIHFSGGPGSMPGEEGPQNYFAHTRTEDLPGKINVNDSMADLVKTGKAKNIDEARAMQKNGNSQTRRVIEIQSDLFQKGRLEGEMPGPGDKITHRGKRYTIAGQTENSYIADNPTLGEVSIPFKDLELSKLESYRNTWHERIIREEVKQAAKDGKTKLQFPTGETAMKIEGLGTNTTWRNDAGYVLKLDEMKIGDTVNQGIGDFESGDNWIITDVLGDGKFKAVQRDQLDFMSETLSELGHNGPDATIAAIAKGDARVLQRIEEGAGTETFDISGKIDTQNPIYKFYEKEVGKYLTKKYGATRITDARGVQWWEVAVKKEFATAPVGAFDAADVHQEPRK